MGLSNKSNNYETMNNVKNGVNKSLENSKFYQKMMLNVNTPSSIKNKPKDKRSVVLYSIMIILCFAFYCTGYVTPKILYFVLIFALLLAYKIFRLFKKDIITEEQQKYYDEIKSDYENKFGKKKKTKEEKNKLEKEYDEYFKSLEEDDKYVNEYNDYDEDEYDYLEDEELDDEE